MTLTVANLTSLAIPLALVVLGAAAGVVLRHTVFVRLARGAARSPSRVDDALVAVASGQVVLWCAAAGLYLATVVAPLPPGPKHVLARLLLVFLIASATWILAVGAAAFVDARARSMAGGLPGVNLVTNLVKLTVFALGGLVALQTLGVSVTPVVTALGVGGLAVGLALQDTLANMFAGVHILLSRQVRSGDYVRLSSGEEGFVQDVTWRYTTILELANNLTIVPNAKLASAITTNFTRPDPEQAVLVEVGVSYDSDLGHVQDVTTAVARAVMREVEGGVPAFEPFIRFHTFGDSSVQFTVILRGRDYPSQYLIKHEFIKRLLARYAAEGITIPFPTRTVALRGTDGDPQPAVLSRDTAARER